MPNVHHTCAYLVLPARRAAHPHLRRPPVRRAAEALDPQAEADAEAEGEAEGKAAAAAPKRTAAEQPAEQEQ